MKLIITEELEGKSVGHILCDVIKLPRASITFLKSKKNGITLNGEHVTVRKLVHQNDVLSLEYSDDESVSELSEITPVKLPLNIIYEDEHIIAVCKPPFMPTHPSHNHQNDTLANALRYYFDSKGIPFIFRAVNRLDNRTSGIVLIAKNRVAAGKLSKNIAEKKISKSYIAILHGELDNDCGEICAPIKRTDDSIIKRQVCNNGAYSLTKYKTIYRNEMYTLAEASPITGRTHQLRVHFSHIGHPICGDSLYGYPSEFIARQALHAYRLSFIHPITEEYMTLTAKPTDDILKLIDTVFGLTPKDTERLLKI